MAKHIHAENMALYAQDAQETPEPWERWEFNSIGRKWSQLTSNPTWVTSIQYRRKPKMLSVTLASGEVVSWPAPHRAELDKRDAYYFADVNGSVIVGKWDCAPWDSDTLSNGYIHLTKEAAEQHAAALLKINNPVAK